MTKSVWQEHSHYILFLLAMRIMRAIYQSLEQNEKLEQTNFLKLSSSTYFSLVFKGRGEGRESKNFSDLSSSNILRNQNDFFLYFSPFFVNYIINDIENPRRMFVLLKKNFKSRCTLNNRQYVYFFIFRKKGAVKIWNDEL